MKKQYYICYRSKTFAYLIFIICIILIKIQFDITYGQSSTLSKNDLKTLKKAESENKLAETTNNKTLEILQKINALTKNDGSVQNSSEIEKLRNQELDYRNQSLTHAFKSNQYRKNVYEKFNDGISDTDDSKEKILEESKVLLNISDSLKTLQKNIKTTSDNIYILYNAYQYETTALDNIEYAYNIVKGWTNITFTGLNQQYSENDNPEFNETDLNYNNNNLQAQDYAISYPNDNIGNLDLNNDSSLLLETNYLLNDAVIIDAEIIERYQNYLNSHKNDSLLLLQNYITGYDYHSLLDFWTFYKNREISEQTEDELFSEENLNKIIDKNRSKCTYRIQITQNTNPISQNMLQRIYSGEYEIKVVNEENVYKYLIGNFTSYEKADSLRNKLNIDGATVICDEESKAVVFVNNTKTAVNNENIDEINPYEFDENRIVFVVQIAASRVPLSKLEVKEIYSGNLKVYLKEEEGWYKYQVGHTFIYEEAKNTLKNVNVPGAFIAAYETNVKHKLWQAIRKSNIQPDKIIYKVQIAASKVELKNEHLKNIYNGNYKVEMIIEEGMFKYQIVAGNSFKEALSIRKECGVRGAFIVPYSNGKKISLKDAIKITE